MMLSRCGDGSSVPAPAPIDSTGVSDLEPGGSDAISDAALGPSLEDVDPTESDGYAADVPTIGPDVTLGPDVGLGPDATLEPADGASESADDVSDDSAAADASIPGDVDGGATTGGAPGQPSWVIEDGCAVPSDWASAGCAGAPGCGPNETCVGDGVCVPSISFYVDPQGPPSQSWLALATGEGPTFAASWAEGSWSDLTQRIMFRVFPNGDSTGTVAIPVISADTNGETGRAPSIASMEDGSWLVLWRSEDEIADAVRYRARRMLGDGTGPASEPFDANITPLSFSASMGSTNVVAPVVVRLRDDTIIMAWTGAPAAPGGALGVYARLFDATGSPITGEIDTGAQLESVPSFSPAIAKLPAGAALLAWEGYSGIGKNGQIVRGRVISGLGATPGPVLTLSPGLQEYEALPAVAAYDEGEVIITTKVGDNANATSEVDIRGQLLAAGLDKPGAPSAPGGAIVTLATDDDGSYPASAPVVALSGERAVAVWQNTGDSKQTIWARRHYRPHDAWDCELTDLAGPALPGEAGTRVLPALAAFEDGHFVVGYTTLLTGFDESRVAARIVAW